MGATEKEKDQYVFSSAPSVPREKTPDILVRFQAASSDRACLKSASVFLSSRSTLLEVRRQIHKTFTPCYERGFIFLWKNKDVLRSRERTLHLSDILPRVPFRVENPLFKFQNVQCKKITYEKDGRRYSCVCCGLIFLYEDCGLSHWMPESLRSSLSASSIFGFEFVPWTVTSARSYEGLSVDTVNELAATGKHKELLKKLTTFSPETEPKHLQDTRGATPLHYAAQNGHLKVCEMLIGRLGRDMLYMKDINKRTPLHCLLTYGKFESPGFGYRKNHKDKRLEAKLSVLSYLLQLAPDLSCRDKQGCSCYHMLFTLGNEMLDEILKRTHLGLLDDRLILHLTCYAIQYQKTTYAKELCALVKVFDPVFYTPPLHLAAEWGMEDLVNILLRKPEESSTGDPSALASKEEEKEEADVEDESAEGYDPRDKTVEGFLPFHFACQHGHHQIVSSLYFEEMSDDDFNKGVRLALEWKQRSVMKTLSLLRNIFQLDGRIKQTIIREAEDNYDSDLEYSRTLIRCMKSERKVLIRFVSQAARVGDLDTLAWFVEQEIDIFQPDLMGRTALHEAAQLGQTECIKFLLEHDANPNERDWRGATPLHYACMAGKGEAVDIIMNCSKVLPSIQDDAGRTPLLAAAHNKQIHVLVLFLEKYHHGLDPHIIDNQGISLHHYLYLFDLKTADTLLQKLTNVLESAVFSRVDKKTTSLVTICEIWRDQSIDQEDKKTRHSQRKIKCTKMRCKQCHKEWTLLGDTVRWKHVCRPRDPPSSETEKVMSQLVECKRENCEEIESVYGPFPSFQSKHTRDNSVFLPLILNNRSELIPILAKHRPDIVEKQGAHVLKFSAYNWYVDSLQALLIHMDVSQDTISSFMHAACVRRPHNADDSEKQTKTVNYLLQRGASPNFIPKEDSLSNDLNIGSTAKRYLFYNPLELAVVHENTNLVNTLLTHGASVCISFALHLAAVVGNEVIFERLLKAKSTEGDIVKGNIPHADDLWRVASLGMGLLQALSTSKKASLKLYEHLIESHRDILESRKLLTRSMVMEIRPQLLEKDSDPLLQRFLSVLPLTSFAKRVQCRLEVESALLQILRKGVYLDEVKISKTSSVHAACDLFVSLMRQKQWNIVEELLRVGGKVIWDCFLSKHSSCNRRVYVEDEEAKAYHVLLHSCLPLLTYAPLSTLNTFFQKGLETLEAKNEDRVLKKVYPMMKESSYKEQLSKESLFTQLASHYVEMLDNSTRSLVASVKLLLLFPKVMTQVTEKVLKRPYLCEWMSVVDRKEFTQEYKAYIRSWKTVEVLKVSSMERRVLFKLLNLGPEVLKEVVKHKSSLMQVLSAIGEAEAINGISGSVDKMDINTIGSDGRSSLDMAAAVGNEAVIDELLKSGAEVTQQTHLALCVGPRFVPFFLHHKRQKDLAEDKRVKIMKNLSSRCEIDVSFNHSEFTNCLKVSTEKRQWHLVNFILEHAKNVASNTLSYRSTILTLANFAPLNILDLLMDKHKESLKFESIQIAREVFFAICNRGHEPLTLFFFKHQLGLYQMDSANSAHQLLSWPDPHGHTSVHVMCRKGNLQALRHALNELTEGSYATNLLDAVDQSEATPLWYAVANRHWDVARCVLIYGGQLTGPRAVPDLYPKRLYTETTPSAASELEYRNVQDTQASGCDSTQVASCLNPGIKTFQNLYQKRPKLKDRRKAGWLMASHVPKHGVADKSKREVQYLLQLTKFSQVHGVRMLEAAAGAGNVGILQEILSLKCFQSMTDKKTVATALLYALSNHQFSVSEILLKNLLHQGEWVLSALAFAILEESGFNFWYTETERVKKKKIKLQEQTELKLKNYFKDKGYKLKDFDQRKMFASQGMLSESDVATLVRTILKVYDGPLPEVLIISLLHYGKLSPILAMLENTSPEYLKPVCDRLTVDGLTIADILLVFTKCDHTLLSEEVESRKQIVKQLSSVCSLSLEERTIVYAMKKELHVLLEEIISAFVKNEGASDVGEIWTEVIYDASRRGFTEIVKNLLEKLYMRSFHEMPTVACRCLSFACFHRQEECVDYLLTQTTRLQQQVVNITPRNKGTWILDFATLGGSPEIVGKVLIALDKSGTIDSFALRESVELAAKCATAEVLDSVLKARIISSVLTKDFMEKILLMTAASGKETACLQMLKIRYLDVRRNDENGNSVLHYACRWNMYELAEEALKTSKDEVKVVNSHGHTPLDLARSMGSVKISKLIKSKHKVDTEPDREVTFTGWLKYCLERNQSHSVEPDDLRPVHSTRKRNVLDLESLLKSSDDYGALAMIEASQETLVGYLRTHYKELPVLHLCAKYGCEKSLESLIDLTDEYMQSQKSDWFNQGPTNPLCLAIENRHRKCVGILAPYHTCFEDVSPLKENVLHVAARTGIDDITETVAKAAPPQAFLAKDINGLTPSATAVAFGHHHLLQYLVSGISADDDEHASHSTIKHQCFSCLLDLAIGWSKMYQLSWEGNNGMVKRDIFNRHKSVEGHPMNKLYTWYTKGAKTELLFAALNTMGYDTSVGMAQLFLHSPNLSITKLLDRKMDAAALIYFSKTWPSSDYTLQQLCYYAGTKVHNYLFHKVLKIQNPTGLFSELGPSLYEIALAFGNTKLVSEIDSTGATDPCATFRELSQNLPDLLRLKLGLSHPGDEEWNLSLSTDLRLSLPDVLCIIYSSGDNTAVIEENVDVNRMIPETYLGKMLNINWKTFQDSLPDFSEVQLRALVLSSLVIGRYKDHVNIESKEWSAITVISLSCLSQDSVEQANVSRSRSTLKDTVKPELVDGKIKITTGEIPFELTETWALRDFVDRTVTNELETLIQRELGGVSIKVTVDWDSVLAVKDLTLMSEILKVLAGDIGSNKLGGLQDIMIQCGDLLYDIKSSWGEAAGTSTRGLLSEVQHITVKYVSTLPILKPEGFLLKDASIYWLFTVKDSVLQYHSDHMPLLRLLKQCWVGYCNLAYSMLVIANKPDLKNPSVDSRRSQTHFWRRNFNWLPMSPLKSFEGVIEWDTFENIALGSKMNEFMRKHVAPEVERISHEYTSMPWLMLDKESISVRITKIKERSGVWLKGKQLVISIYAIRGDAGLWATGDNGFRKFLFQAEEKQLLLSANRDEQTHSEQLVKVKDKLKEQTGMSINVLVDDDAWLKGIHKEDFFEHTNPVNLMEMYFNNFTYDTQLTVADTILQDLLFCRTNRLLGTFNIPSGFWFWVTMTELKTVKDSQILLRLKLAKHQLKFELVEPSEIKTSNSENLTGIWQCLPFHEIKKASKQVVKRVNLMSFSRKLMFICDVKAMESVINSIPAEICVRANTEKNKVKTDRRELTVSLSDIFSPGGYLREIQNYCPKEENLAYLARSQLKHAQYLYDVWLTGINLGTNVAFIREDFQDTNLLEPVGYVMKTTLDEITAMPERIENKDGIMAAIADICTIQVGFQHADSPAESLGRVKGSKYSEIADIILLTKTDLRISFKKAILEPDIPLKPITETLVSAICRSFEFQTSVVMADTLKAALDKEVVEAHDVNVFQFYTRHDKDAILTAAVESRTNFTAALSSVTESHMDVKQKLARELISVEFQETCSSGEKVTTFQNGKLKYSVFKDDHSVASKKEIEKHLLTAITEEDEGKDADRLTSLENNFDQADDAVSDTMSVLTVTSPPKTNQFLPKLERLRRPAATSRLALQRANESIFNFVEIGHTGNIDNVLDVGADINCRDNERRTPLILAAELRNYVLQSMLLSRGADTNKTDKEGRSALHIEAAHGDVESLKLFLAHSAKVNARDQDGRTPLHYAVSRKKTAAVDILVFCGADVNIKDKMGVSPNNLTTSRPLLRLLQESRQTVYGIQNGYVFVEHTSMGAGSTYHLKSLDLTIRTPDSVGTGSVNWIGRRVRPEYSRSSLGLVGKELLLSDVFEFRLSGTRPEGQMIMKVPIYTNPDLWEEVYMKTDKGVHRNKIRDVRYEEEKKQWYCYIRMDISSINAFLLVALPKVEKFPISSEEATLSSKVDSLVEIKIEADTFSRSGILTLELLPKPHLYEEEFSPVLSLSDFYDINHTKGEQPQNDVLVTLPVPHDYCGEGKLFALLRSEETKDSKEEDLWEILDRNPTVRNGLVTISVPHFSNLNLIEQKCSEIDEAVAEDRLIEMTAKLFQKANRREMSVVFMAMLRPLDEPNSGCEAVVECIRNTQLYPRLDHWKMEGYQDQKPSHTDEFIAVPDQEYLFDLGGNTQKVNNVVTKLHYHPKRKAANYLKFQINLKDEKKDRVGWVDITQTQAKHKQDDVDAGIENFLSKFLAQIQLYMANFIGLRGQSETAKDEKATKEEAEAFEVFTNKHLLQQLANKMGREWTKVATLIGFSQASVDKLKAEEGQSDTDKKLKILTVWRDRRLHRSDHGVPELLIALKRCKREVLVRLVLDALKKWLNEKTERRDRFFTWLEKALTGSGTSPTGLLEPMSDDFLLALVRETGVVFHLASDVDISQPELENILADPLSTTEEVKMLKLFETSRDKQKSRGVAYEVLIEGLTTMGMEQPRNWMLRTAREWINNTGLSDDPFAHAINDFLEEAEVKYLPRPSPVSNSNENTDSEDEL